MTELEVIRDAVIRHMGAPEDVPFEPALDAMALIEPGDTPAAWMVLGTIRYFFFLKRWRFDNPHCGDILERFYSSGAASWSTGQEYRTKTAEAIATWYNYDIPNVVVQEVVERKAPPKKKKAPVKYQSAEIKAPEIKEPKDDGLEKRMAKRIAKQRG